MRCKSISEFIMCFMLSLFSLTAFAQIKITGTASDAETGEPLSFITIQIKGTTAGTTSVRVLLPIWMEIIQLRYLIEMPF